LLAPLIPALNDHELERMLAAAAEAGVTHAGYVLLRLPDELRPLFIDWLETHYPERAQHVLSLLRQMRGGRLNDSEFHRRQSGQGPIAELIRRRFDVARRRHGLQRQECLRLRTDLFRPPRQQSPQLSLLE
jgi:DNA repair photolyase